MTPEQVRAVQAAIDRGTEVFDTLLRIKGERYALKVAMFVSCHKMFMRLYDPSHQEHQDFTAQLLDAFGYSSDDPQAMLDFVKDFDMLRRAQEVQ